MLLCSSDDEDTERVMDTGLHRDIPLSGGNAAEGDTSRPRSISPRTRDVVRIMDDRPMSPPSIEYTYEDVKESPKYDMGVGGTEV